jgi:hypothetical protein
LADLEEGRDIFAAWVGHWPARQICLAAQLCQRNFSGWMLGSQVEHMDKSLLKSHQLKLIIIKIMLGCN